MITSRGRNLAVLGVAAVIAAIWLWFGQRQSQLQEKALQTTIEDPGSVSSGLASGGAAAGQAVENQFVGHGQCRECHAEIHASHSATPHFRTMASTRESAVAAEFCRQQQHAGDDFGTFHYACDAEGLTAEISQRFPGRLFPLDYAFGSGSHAVTFVTLLKDRGETVLVEHRMSWFSHGKTIGITPGQEDEVPNRDMSCFGKIFTGKDMHRCVSCHVTTGRVADGAIHDLTAGIHCERCHGPGSAHVQAAEQDQHSGADLAIRRPMTAPEEVAMCGECHRMPSEIAPERLRQYPKSLVRFQPVGLLQSPCYLRSQSVMKCTTCHDPHAPVGSRTMEQQVNSCRSCHSASDQKSCGAGHPDRCIECHMPAVELLPGISFHDHWIRIRNPDDDNLSAGSSGHTVIGGNK